MNVVDSGSHDLQQYTVSINLNILDGFKGHHRGRTTCISSESSEALKGTLYWGLEPGSAHSTQLTTWYLYIVPASYSTTLST